MTTPDDQRDTRLAELLADAVSDVEPTDRFDAIRNRKKVSPMSARRPWFFAVGGAAVATAAVVTAIALAGGDVVDRASDDPPIGQEQPDEGDQSPAPSESEEPSEPAESTSPPAQGGTAVPVYFAVEQPVGMRLSREFHPSGGGDPVLEAATATVTGDALDPDYRSLWPEGSSVASVDTDAADVVVVDVTGAPHDRPSGLSEEDAGIAVQQLVYSVQAAYGDRVGVQVLLDGERSDTVLGQPTSEPLTNAPVLQTLSLVNLTTPEEGQSVTGTLEVSGVANSYEANVIVRVQRWEGTEVVAQEPITAEGWMEEKLFPFSGTIDLSDVPPGDYLVTAMTDDPSGGTEGPGAQSDTKLVTVG